MKIVWNNPGDADHPPIKESFRSYYAVQLLAALNRFGLPHGAVIRAPEFAEWALDRDDIKFEELRFDKGYFFAYPETPTAAVEMKLRWQNVYVIDAT